MFDALTSFLQAATPAQREALGKVAGTSLAQLHHIIAGRREASATLAARVETAVGLLRRNNPKLPRIDRRDIAPVCHACPLAKAA